MLKNLYGQGLGSGFDYWTKGCLSLMGPPIKYYYHSNITKVEDWAFQLRITYRKGKRQNKPIIWRGEPFETPATTEIHLQCFKTGRLLCLQFLFKYGGGSKYEVPDPIHIPQLSQMLKYYHYSSLQRDHTLPSQRPRGSRKTWCHSESPQFSLRDKWCFCGLWTFVCHLKFGNSARESHPNPGCWFMFYLSNHGDLFIAHMRFERLRVHMPNPKLPQGVLEAEGRGL